MKNLIYLYLYKSCLLIVLMKRGSTLESKII
jgi:hypothetical protein